ncbi:hypothetical protein [Flavobacterium hydrophilum]|uniref:Uncharacterized protein n=1 Tax=Flavobacterium hydrophilum TaxID=2211445 RepID=A0A2V4C2E6_9FLAO|nr:hypothetical protein [Flavobacterium hydrophilum]PXY45355.1 hypothetical protein DMB68_11785 [Flavobacterium hydrophilum]
MKQFYKKLSIFFTVVILLFTSCSKDETTKEEPASYSLLSSETLPGEVVEIKTSKENKEQEIEVLLDGKPVKAYANGGYSYVFMTPVLPSGNYDIILPSNKDNVTLKIKIGNYVAITQPEEVINEFINNRDESFEEIKKMGTTPETLLLIDQVKQEWEFQYSKVSEADKLQLAYILQKNTINPDWFSAPSEYPENYYNKSTIFALDAGEKLVTTAKEFVTAETVCLASIPALVGTGRLFIAAPNFVTGAIFVATFTVFIVSREVAINKAKQVGNLKGVAEAVSDLSNKTGDLVLVKDVDTDVSLKVNFRNLKEADLNIQPDITKAFNGEKKFAEEDGKIKKLYDQAIQFTQKLKGLFVNHTATIGKTPERSMTLAVLDKDIIVKGSGNADVKISTTLNGEVRKIKATSTSTKDIDFTLKIAYKRAVDGVEIVKDIPCVLKASATLLGTWELESFENGIPVGQYRYSYSNTCKSIATIYSTTLKKTFVFTENTYSINQRDGYIDYNYIIDYSNCSIEKDYPDLVGEVDAAENGTYVFDGKTFSYTVEKSGFKWAYEITFISANKIKMGGDVYVRK